jgi:hypothetical protein
MFNENYKKLCIAVLMATLFGCGSEADEAKKLGFASVDEMKEAHTKGWHTQQKYYADNPDIARKAQENKTAEGTKDAPALTEYKAWLNVDFPEVLKRAKSYENINYVAQVKSGEIDLGTGMRKMSEQIDLCNSTSSYLSNLNYKTDPARQLSKFLLDGNKWQCQRYELILGMIKADNKETTATVVEKVKALDEQAKALRQSSDVYTKEACEKFSCGQFAKKLDVSHQIDSQANAVEYDLQKLAIQLGAEKVTDCLLVTSAAPFVFQSEDKRFLYLSSVFAGIYTELSKNFNERELKSFSDSMATRHQSYSRQDNYTFTENCILEPKLQELGKVVMRNMSK